MKRALKWLGLISGGLTALLLIVYLIIYININGRINKTYAFTEETIPIPDDSATMARGAHLVAIKGCTDCHGDNLAGKIMIEDAGLGTLVASNLTKGVGGLPDEYSTQDWLMALRHGVDKSGRPLLLMPSHESTLLTEEDLTAIVAYCQNLPRVNNPLPKNKIGPIVRIMTFMGKMPLLSVEKIDHKNVLSMNSVGNDMVARGRYLAISCKGCHRDSMRGGDPMAPGMPAVPDISAYGPSGKWTDAQFMTMLRTGTRPDGSHVSNDNMPWKMTAQYTDEEINALYAYLHSLK